MKNRMNILLAAMMISATLTMPACWFGQKARDGAVRQIQVADDGVRADADSGVVFLPVDAQSDASAEIGAFFDAVAGDRQTIQGAVGQWAQIRAWAEIGIAGREGAGEIGGGVAFSKRVRLDEFERTLYNLAGITLPPGD